MKARELLFELVESALPNSRLTRLGVRKGFAVYRFSVLGLRRVGPRESSRVSGAGFWGLWFRDFLTLRIRVEGGRYA